MGLWPRIVGHQGAWCGRWQAADTQAQAQRTLAGQGRPVAAPWHCTPRHHPGARPGPANGSLLPLLYHLANPRQSEQGCGMGRGHSSQAGPCPWGAQTRCGVNAGLSGAVWTLVDSWPAAQAESRFKQGHPKACSLMSQSTLLLSVWVRFLSLQLRAPKRSLLSLPWGELRTGQRALYTWHLEREETGQSPCQAATPWACWGPIVQGEPSCLAWQGPAPGGGHQHRSWTGLGSWRSPRPMLFHGGCACPWWERGSFFFF